MSKSSAPTSAMIAVALVVVTASVAALVAIRLQEEREKAKSSTEVSFFSADESFRIHGNLSFPPEVSPQEKIPAIVIVAGSGPIDRDGNAVGFLTGMKLNTSNRFAEFMMDRRVAVLSYDKRGVGKSVSLQDKNLYYRAGMMDLVSDAVQAVRFLQGHNRIDSTRIVLMGHSEGAILLPLIYQKISTQDGPPIKGCIFLAGFGENLFDAVAMQQETVIQEVQQETGFKGWILRKLVTREKVKKQFDDLIKKVESDVDKDFLRMYGGLAKVQAKWFREHKKYDAASAHSDLEGLTCHCLAITGQKDVQTRNHFCNTTTAKTLVPRAASVESYRPENLTHILRSTNDPARILNIKEDYPRMGKLPLDEELLCIIGKWCDRVVG